LVDAYRHFAPLNLEGTKYIIFYLSKIDLISFWISNVAPIDPRHMEAQSELAKAEALGLAAEVNGSLTKACIGGTSRR
jgi:hypothetical protein